MWGDHIMPPPKAVFVTISVEVQWDVTNYTSGGNTGVTAWATIWLITSFDIVKGFATKAQFGDVIVVPFRLIPHPPRFSDHLFHLFLPFYFLFLLPLGCQGLHDTQGELQERYFGVLPAVEDVGVARLVQTKVAK